MIGKRGNSLVINPSVFNQLEVKILFPFEVLGKNVAGYACPKGLVWILYEEDGEWVKVPFARNDKWFNAILSEPEFVALKKLKRIYVV